MLNDCKYNKVKLLHELSSLAWFIDQCALKDAEKSNEDGCLEVLKDLSRDLKKYTEAIEKAMQPCS